MLCKLQFGQQDSRHDQGKGAKQRSREVSDHRNTAPLQPYLRGDGIAVMACRQQRRLIHKVGQLRAAEAGGAPRQQLCSGRGR